MASLFTDAFPPQWSPPGEGESGPPRGCQGLWRCPPVRQVGEGQGVGPRAAAPACWLLPGAHEVGSSEQGPLEVPAPAFSPPSPLVSQSSHSRVPPFWHPAGLLQWKISFLLAPWAVDKQFLRLTILLLIGNIRPSMQLRVCWWVKN